MIKPIEEINYKNVRKELSNVRSFIESTIKCIVDANPSMEHTVPIEKAKEVIYKIDCLMNTALVIDLEKLYTEAVSQYEIIDEIHKSLK